MGGSSPDRCRGGMASVPSLLKYPDARERPLPRSSHFSHSFRSQGCTRCRKGHAGRLCAISGTSGKQGRGADRAALRPSLLCGCSHKRALSGEWRCVTPRERPLPALCRAQRRDLSESDLPSSRYRMGIPPVRATRYSVESDVHGGADRADTEPVTFEDPEKRVRGKRGDSERAASSATLASASSIPTPTSLQCLIAILPFRMALAVSRRSAT
jgi:hypothetical protein